MTDWANLPGGRDFSHWNGEIDWDKEADQGILFAILKATDGMSVDPMFDQNRKACIDRKIPYLWYPFLEPGDGDQVIAHAISVVGDKTVPPALDWEKTGVASVVVDDWIAQLETDARAGLCYYGLYPPDRVTATIASWPRWYPQYPGDPNAPPRLPMWDGTPNPDWSSCWLLWQWSEKVRDPATDGLVDADRLACGAATWSHWYETGELVPYNTAPPIPSAPAQRVLRLNMSGADVLALQMSLNRKGARLPADGIFGARTRAAVMQFQQLKGLPADGIAGPDTLQALAA